MKAEIRFSLTAAELAVVAEALKMYASAMHDLAAKNRPLLEGYQFAQVDDPRREAIRAKGILNQITP